MKPKRFPPTDPREWLRRAPSNLVHAPTVEDEVDLAELCFDAQQAAEKAIKAVFIHSTKYRRIGAVSANVRRGETRHDGAGSRVQYRPWSVSRLRPIATKAVWLPA